MFALGEAWLHHARLPAADRTAQKELQKELAPAEVPEAPGDSPCCIPEAHGSDNIVP